MTGLPIKYRDGAWQVHVPTGEEGVWVVCESESDTYRLASSSDVVNDALEGFDGEQIALELEQCAILSLKYGLAFWAHYLREAANLALHQPSAFDGHIWD